MRFHLISPSVLPLLTNFQIYAHTNHLLQFSRMLKSHGHHVIVYGFGLPNGMEKYTYQDIVYRSLELPKEVCDQYIRINPVYDISQVFSNNWYDYNVRGIDDRDRLKDRVRYSQEEFLNEQYQEGDFIGISEYYSFKIQISRIFNIMYFGGYNNCNNVVACSKTFLNLAIDNGIIQKPTKHCIVHPWLNFKNIRLKQNKVRNTFLFLGRCTFSKGFNFFMKLAKVFNNYTFIVAGPVFKMENNTIYDFNGDIYELDTYSNVKYIGIVSSKAKYDLLGDVTALIQLSLYHEPFGINVIEAYAVGTPVICTNYGTFVETVIDGETGFLMNHNSTWNDFSTAMRRCDDIDPHKLRSFCEKNFNEEVAYHRYLEFLQTL